MKHFNTVYLVNDEGKIFKDLGHRIVELKPCINSWGYLVFCIRPNGVAVMYKLHRVVAEAFIPNPENYPQVNHKNGNKLDNRVENLEWCTNKMNQEHKARTGLCSKGNKRISEEKRQSILEDHKSTGHGSCRLAMRHNVGINAVYRLLKKQSNLS